MNSIKASPVACKNVFRRLIGEHFWSVAREKRFGPRTVVNDYGGHELKIYITDWIAREWYGTGVRELDEIKWLSKHGLREGARVFDIGAHQSVVALMLARTVGRTGHIVSVEADYHNARIGKINVDLNNSPNVDVIYAAAAAENGVLDIGTVRNVEALTIDSLTRKYGAPDVLYIDVDGVEADVLRGASDTIANYQPDIFVEVHVGAGLEAAGGSVGSVLKQIPSNVYTLHVLSDELDAQPIPYDPNLEILQQRFFLLATNGKPRMA